MTLPYVILNVVNINPIFNGYKVDDLINIILFYIADFLKATPCSVLKLAGKQAEDSSITKNRRVMHMIKLIISSS